MSLQGKTAIITGASRGIGKAVAYALAGEGCNLVLTATNENKLKETVNKSKKKGTDAIHITGDIRENKTIKKIIDESMKKFGRIDIVVNNAGVLIEKNIEDTTEQEYDWVMDVNVKGIFLMCSAVIPIMKKQGSGTIVNISSGAGQTGYASLSIYCASKFAVIGLTESIAREHREIKAYAVCPGSVDTDMLRNTWPGYKASLKAEDVAKTVVDACKGKYKSGERINARKR